MVQQKKLWTVQMKVNGKKEKKQKTKGWELHKMKKEAIEFIFKQGCCQSTLWSWMGRQNLPPEERVDMVDQLHQKYAAACSDRRLVKVNTKKN